MQRRQFPVRAAFSMTINKAQGQTLGNYGVYLQSNSFAHGQLYTALSRASDPGRVRALIIPQSDLPRLFAPDSTPPPLTATTAAPVPPPPRRSRTQNTEAQPPLRHLRVHVTKNIVYDNVLTYERGTDRTSRV